MSKCYSCSEPADRTCTSCKKPICEDSSCGMDTVDGYRCGEYTQWGCARKYTTCDECCDDKAIHEGDMNFCEQCGNGYCDTCNEDHECESDDDTGATGDENQES